MVPSPRKAAGERDWAKLGGVLRLLIRWNVEVEATDKTREGALGLLKMRSLLLSELWEYGIPYFHGRVDLSHSICNSRELGKGRNTSPL